MEERLQKIIAEAGYTSRRKAEELITKGKVRVNGKVVRELGTKAKYTDEIIVEGNLLTRDENVYYLLNKPRGVICSNSDDKGRTAVVDLIETDKRVFPVGRLDYDTTGLLILTNDGELTNVLTHPKCNVPKTYLAKLNRILDMDDFFQLRDGIEIDGRKVNVKHIKIRKTDKKKTCSFVEITINEGRNHIIKRMFEKLGYDVVALTRISYANLTIGTLLSGEYRTLTKKEVHELYSYKRG